MFRNSPASNRQTLAPYSPQAPNVIQGIPGPQQIRQSPIQQMKPSYPTLVSQVVPNLGQPLSSTLPIISAPGPCQIERIEQPLQVVDLFQVEEPWRRKVEELEAEIERLKFGRAPQAPATKTQEKTVYVQDEAKIAVLQKELDENNAQVQDLINTLKVLQEDNSNLVKTIQSKNKEIDDLQDEVNKLEDELKEANRIIEEYRTELESYSTETTEKHSILMSEINTWKQKFVELNREYHKHQEALELTKAELDQQKAMANQKASVEVTTTSVRRSGTRQQS